MSQAIVSLPAEQVWPLLASSVQAVPGVTYIARYRIPVRLLSVKALLVRAESPQHLSDDASNVQPGGMAAT